MTDRIWILGRQGSQEPRRPKNIHLLSLLLNRDGHQATGEVVVPFLRPAEHQ